MTLALPVEALEKLRQAGRVAAATREEGARRIVPGALVREVCESVEEAIRRLGAEPAFPTQSSRNELAAHYCPSPEDRTAYEEGDLAKLDIGVHVDGYVVDTALTVNVGDRPANRVVVQAARDALDAAIAVAAPDVPVRRISEAIERAIQSYGLRPMRNLCGHGVGRWTVHCPPAIPNAPDASTDRLRVGSVIAIEPFATDGLGLVAERGPAEVFRLHPDPWAADGLDAEVMQAIRAFHGLPFARRQLARFPRGRVEATLEGLRRRRWLSEYPPLAETGGRRVAQAEHSLYIGVDGVEVLTR
jgi:methionyl aminopeptidase